MCGSKQTVENSSRDRNTRPPYLSPKKNLDVGQEETVRSRRGTIDWLKIVKRVRQGCTLSPCLYNLYAEYIMGNAMLDGSQAVIKTAGRNINSLRYTDDTTLMAENFEGERGE